MTANQPTEMRDVEVLAEDECRRLLGSRTLGRLALVVDGTPQIFPVNYAFAEGVVIIRSAPGLKLQHSPMTEVAFETDMEDAKAGIAWSVMVQGTAFDITDTLDTRYERLRHMRVEPEAPGKHDHWMGVYVHRISGRRFALSTL